MHRYVAMIPVVSDFFLKNNENNNKNTMEVTNDVTHPKKNENETLSFSFNFFINSYLTYQMIENRGSFVIHFKILLILSHHGLFIIRFCSSSSPPP